MARASTNVERNTFIRGLVTEAGPLTFPENASKDELNFILNRDGSRQRRLGMDYEDLGVQVDTSLSTVIVDGSSISSFRWDNVGNDSSLSIGVIQISDKLWFLDMTTSAPSANLLNSGSFITITQLVDTPFSYTSVNGILVIVSEGLDNPVFLEYNETTDTVTQDSITLEVRDIWGVADSLGITDREATLSDEHKYNLLNQGWDSEKITSFFTSQSVYPSNADIWILGKDSNDDFDPALLIKQDFGTTLASKGRFIIDAFNRGSEREAATSITGLPADQETGNVSTVTSFAGRVFYSGVRGNITESDSKSPSFSGTIFFSQIVDSNSKLGFCYQDGDPTSEFTAEVVANDGGTIQIPEAAGIIKIVPKENVLLVFAENGVWVISGNELGFTADNFAVRRVTNVGAVGSESIVDVDGNTIYWSKGGIYQLTPDPRTGRLIAQNITERTIQTKFNSISSPAKQNSKGIFDSPARQVRWLYNDDDFDGTTRASSFNRELVLDLVLGAFYILDITEITSGPYVSSYLQTTEFINSTVQELVVIGPDVVQVNGVDVVISKTVRSRGNSVTKYVTIIPGTTDKFTLSSFSDPDFLDWKTFNTVGVDAPAFLLTGEELFGDTQRDKGVSYLTVHCSRTETGFFLDGSGDLQPENPSSCQVQSRWDFSDTTASGKFGKTYEAYRLTRVFVPTGVSDPFDYGQEVITTKTKLRGSGRALSIRFSTSVGKDLLLFGWGIAADGNTQV